MGMGSGGGICAVAQRVRQALGVDGRQGMDESVDCATSREIDHLSLFVALLEPLGP